MSSNMTKRALLIETLKGASLAIPDLESMITHWPSAVNENMERLRNEVHGRLENLFPPGQWLDKMKLADAALFGSSWWPYATLENLCTVTHLSTWLFAWDDELDSAEYASLVNDVDQASSFRTETLHFIHDLGYQHISHQTLKWPLGPWDLEDNSDTAGEMILRNFLQFINAAGAAILQSGNPGDGSLQLSKDEAMLLVEEAKVDLEHNWKTHRYWLCMKIFTAQKILNR